MRRRAFWTGTEEGMLKARQNRQVWPLKNLSAQIQEPKTFVRFSGTSGVSGTMPLRETVCSCAIASPRFRVNDRRTIAWPRQYHNFNRIKRRAVITQIESMLVAAQLFVIILQELHARPGSLNPGELNHPPLRHRNYGRLILKNRARSEGLMGMALENEP